MVQLLSDGGDRLSKGYSLCTEASVGLTIVWWRGSDCLWDTPSGGGDQVVSGYTQLEMKMALFYFRGKNWI